MGAAIALRLPTPADRPPVRARSAETWLRPGVLLAKRPLLSACPRGWPLVRYELPRRDCGVPMRRPARARAGMRRRSQHQRGWRLAPTRTASDRASGPMTTSVQLQSTNAQTLSKAEEYERPESKTIQQLAEP